MRPYEACITREDIKNLVKTLDFTIDVDVSDEFKRNDRPEFDITIRVSMVDFLFSRKRIKREIKEKVDPHLMVMPVWNFYILYMNWSGRFYGRVPL